MDGAAALAARVFDWAEAGPVEDDVRYAAMHGLYWLVANLAARQPLVLAVDDAHWADAPSLRWLAHLAARVERPAGRAAARGARRPGRARAARRAARGRDPAAGWGRSARTPPPRWSAGGSAPCPATASTAPMRSWAGTGTPAPAGTRSCSRRWPPRCGTATRRRSRSRRRCCGGSGPRVPRRGRLTRALAVLGGPAPLRQAAALAGLDLPAAARLADRLRAADVLAPGSVLEFAHPIVRTAVYESIPPGERALAHAEAARLLERDGADAERLALHLLRSEPGADPRVAALLRAAAAAATGRGDPGAAAACLRRALDEPPPAADRPGLLLELGIALARERSPAAVPALREAVELRRPGRRPAGRAGARHLGLPRRSGRHLPERAGSGPVPDDAGGQPPGRALPERRDQRRNRGGGGDPAAPDRPVSRLGGQRRAAGRDVRGRRRRSPCPPWTASRPIPWARCTRCWCSSGPASSRWPGGSATRCSRTPGGAAR